MKRAWLLVSIIFIIQSTIFPQEVKTIAQEAFIQETIQEKSYPIPGSHLLREKEQKILEYFKQHPDANRLAKPRSTAWNFDVDSTYTWWADSLIDGAGQYQVPSTCQAKGTNCYIFVEDAVWGTNQVDQAAIDAIVDAFDNSTPQGSIDPSKGIFDIDVQTFGTPPDVDNDPRIILLILDIRDGYDGSGGYAAGYFYSANEYPDGDPALEEVRSNYTEIFYMDCNPADLITDRTDVLNTTAHEFQHMIHWAHDTNESTFVNEGLSEIASYICGYGLRSSGLYAQNTNVNLLSWDQTGDVLEDYSRTALWTLYMYEQFPIDIMKDFVDRSHGGWASFNATIGTYAADRGFFSTFEDWLLANYINDVSVDSRYGYNYFPLAKPTPTKSHIGNINVLPTTVSVDNLAAQYIEFSGGSNLTVTFSDVDGILRIWAIKVGNNTVVEKIENNSIYTPIGYGSTYDKVTFLIYSKSTVGDPKSFTYSATGTAVTGSMELAYESGEPDSGYLGFNEGDTIAVYFDGIDGFSLDSIKIAFIQNGDMQIQINEFTNIPQNSTNSPFGQPLFPLQLITSDVGGTPDWYNIDLTSLNIDASNDFIVGGVIGSDPAVPGICIVSEPPVGNDHTLFYSFANWGDRWVFPVGDKQNDGNIWKYLIRAYVSVGGGTVLAQPTITSIVANQGNVQLSWNSSAGPVEGYNIYRSTSTGFIPDNNNIIGNVGSTVTTYTDALPNIQANTDYYYRLSSFDGDGNESDFSDEVTIKTLDVIDINGIPTEYNLNSNYPNPFNPSTTFRFSTPKDGLVKFTVHDLLGRVVYSENRNLFAGNYSFTWEGNNMLNQQVVSGVYFLRMETEGFSQTRKMLLLR